MFNCIYLIPLLLMYLFEYSDEGAAGALDILDKQSLGSICAIYAEGLAGFTLGSLIVGMALRPKSRPTSSLSYPPMHIGTAERIVVVLVAGLLIGAKAALIPLGVYHVYAADSGEMAGGIWSFAMVCAECLLFVSILMLYSDSRWNVRGFLFLTALNGVNLLHGTRIIFIVNLLAFILYAYIRGVLTIKRILIYGPLAFAGVLAVAFLVFIARSGSTLTDGLSLARALSPIIYESLFSQLSLGTVVASPDIMNSTGALPGFLTDVIIFTAPRFMVPDKDALTYIHSFAYMSPLGAFNGYAAGLIYFGVFWPLFYFTLGGFAAWLYARAKSSPYWWVFYAYFTADVLFRFMRDGYLIPIKIMGDMLLLLMALIVFKALIRGLARRNGQPALS